MWKIKTRIELPLRTSAQMLEQAVEAVVEARIPLIPVVATRAPREIHAQNGALPEDERSCGWTGAALPHRRRLDRSTERAQD